MTFSDSIRTCFSNYATFSGRAIRSEYWWFALFLIIVSALLGFFSDALSAAFSLATLLPSMAVAARRLHDSDKSGWWQVAPLGSVILTAVLLEFETNILAFASGAFAVVSVVLVLVWLIKTGTPGRNRFGPDPLGPNRSDDEEGYSESSIPKVD